MSLRKAASGLALGLLALGAVACGSAPSSNGTPSSAPVTLQETGSSLLYPLFNIWAPAYHASHTGVQISTGSTGSGTGIASAVGGTVEIGASDAYMPQSQIAQHPGTLNIPLAISAQVVAYNVPGVSVPHLNLSGPVLAAMYSGTITRWNDPAIAAMNPGVSLPNLPIVPIHRTDSSGDSFLFTQYLSFTTPSWNSKVGYSTSPTFPSVASALGAVGNSGMVSTLAQTKGGVAYVGISYLASLEKTNLAYAALKNRDGSYVLPTSANIQAAAAAKVGQTPADERISLIFAPGANSYPIINYEYAIVETKQSSPQIAQAVKGFLGWALTKGNAPTYLDQVNFVPLPSSVVALSEKQVAKIHG